MIVGIVFVQKEQRTSFVMIHQCFEEQDFLFFTCFYPVIDKCNSLVVSAAALPSVGCLSSSVRFRQGMMLLTCWQFSF